MERKDLNKSARHCSRRQRDCLHGMLQSSMERISRNVAVVGNMDAFCRTKKTCPWKLERVSRRCCMNYSNCAKILNTRRAGPDHLNTRWERQVVERWKKRESKVLRALGIRAVRQPQNLWWAVRRTCGKGRESKPWARRTLQPRSRRWRGLKPPRRKSSGWSFQPGRTTESKSLNQRRRNRSVQSVPVHKWCW